MKRPLIPARFRKPARRLVYILTALMVAAVARVLIWGPPAPFRR